MKINCLLSKYDILHEFCNLYLPYSSPFSGGFTIKTPPTMQLQAYMVFSVTFMILIKRVAVLQQPDVAPTGPHIRLCKDYFFC